MHRGESSRPHTVSAHSRIDLLQLGRNGVKPVARRDADRTASSNITRLPSVKTNGGIVSDSCHRVEWLLLAEPGIHGLTTNSLPGLIAELPWSTRCRHSTLHSGNVRFQSPTAIRSHRDACPLSALARNPQLMRRQRRTREFVNTNVRRTPPVR